MNWRQHWFSVSMVVGGFLAAYHLPVDSARFNNALAESLELTRWYAREHVLLCLVPAFLIAGGISVFLNQNAVMKYLGAGANRLVAYGVASVSGTILAVCSCTVLPLFAGIYRLGAGLGPATAFLYAGPAINVLAIILTGRILGLELGFARALAAVLFSVVIGLLMQLLFARSEEQRVAAQAPPPDAAVIRPLWQTLIFFGSLLAVLVFANWGVDEGSGGFWNGVHALKWWLTSGSLLVLGVAVVTWYRSDWQEWLAASWGFAKQILPLLLLGVLVAGFLLGRPGQEGVVPSSWVAAAVGGNSLSANFFASVAGTFMYFATLTEVPILQGLLGAGMGQGPALALLLAGPALSLPSILVLHSIMGAKRTLAFIGLVVVMATASGLIFGVLAG